MASGRGLATTAPTYGLAKDVTLLVRKLPPALFDKNLKQRPCGLLCKLGAAGMLICDVLGLPTLVEFQDLYRNVRNMAL